MMKCYFRCKQEGYYVNKDIFKFLKEERGEHFDPKLIDIFFENIDEILAFRDAHQD